MDTLDIEEPATSGADLDTQTTDLSDESGHADTSTDGTQEDAAILLKRISDKDKHIVKLETELRTKEKPDNRSDDIKELEWKLENKDRINLVKDEYEKIVAEGYQGEPVSKRIALELAEKHARVDTSGTKRDRQNDMTTPSVTTRSANPTGYEDEMDQRLGLTIEKKRKLEERHPHLKQV